MLASLCWSASEFLPHVPSEWTFWPECVPRSLACTKKEGWSRTIFQHCPEWLTCLSTNISAHHSRNNMWQSHLYIFNVNRRQFIFHPAYQSDGYLPGLCWKHLDTLLVITYSCINLIRSDLILYLYILRFIHIFKFYQKFCWRIVTLDGYMFFSSCTTEFVITFVLSRCNGNFKIECRVLVLFVFLLLSVCLRR